MTRVSVVVPYSPTISETFIVAHIELLPAEITVVHGWPPAIKDQPVLSRPQRLVHKCLEAFGGESSTTAAYLEVFRRHRPAVVLAEYGTTAVLVMRACQLADIPLVAHFHGFDASIASVVEEHSEAYRELFQQAAAIIAVSRAMERKLSEMGAPAQTLHYNPYGVDCQRFSGAMPATTAPVFLAVGRFVEKKAPHLTIRAFSKVHEQFPAARLRMIGEGPTLSACTALVHELGIDDQVAFLTAQPATVVADEMRTARCFVQHSIQAASGDSEGTPVGILEAGASGLPVVSTRHAGIPDVVIDGETGFLVDEGDVDGMAECMLRIAREPALAAALGEAARRRIQSHFAIEQSISALWRILESCMSRRPTPSV